MRRLIVIAVLLAGCIPLTESPGGPAYGNDSEAMLSERGNAIWRAFNGLPGFTVMAHRGIGSPVAEWHDNKVEMYVPVGANGAVADAIMRYELSKVAYVLGNGSWLSNLFAPARAVDAATHLPPSVIVSWYAVVTGVRP